MAISAVSYEHLQILPFEMTLHHVMLVKKINDHAKLTFTGIISEEQEDHYVRMADEDTPVELLYADENGQSKRLFHGTILKLHVKVEHNVYWLEAEAISHTHAMDLKPETRSFQNKSMLIHDLMQKISGYYPKGQTFNTFEEDSQLGAYTLQYQETDWQFLKRLASRYHAVLVPVSTEDSVRVYLGIPDHRDAGELEATHYRMYKDMLAYKKEAAAGKSGLSEQDYICYEVMLHDQVLELGDKVTFKGQQLHVFEVRTEMKQGLLTHHYTLGLKRAAYRRTRTNSKLVGASISGKVMEVVRDEVKVRLDYDQDWSLGTAIPFPYSTMYASDDQTGWYCMPEKGDSVRIYFPNAKEAEGIALSSVRKKLPEEAMAPASSPGSTSGAAGGHSQNVTTTVVQQEQLQPIINYDKDLKEDLMANPNTKFLLTPTGQKITFEEDKITITGAVGGATITLTSAGTIILNCENKIMLQASKQIEMVSESIMMVANQIEMSTKDAKGGLTMDQGQVVIKGIEVLMNQ
ncbi:contractile injection system protein, VgrG/Pvc8 family [Paenibacillus durus]|uniref:contractile injection system protein, VgrG/Pvc8 family n=1 Tax=Paenibacillus durus TaxID=44251 RepID=UPI000694BA25|nr:contractile injection system protein, VgrG/Pvc8 family [Paenibacillus durus]